MLTITLGTKFHYYTYNTKSNGFFKNSEFCFRHAEFEVLMEYSDGNFSSQILNPKVQKPNKQKRPSLKTQI